MTSDDLGNFLTHVTTFHDLRMTLTTHADDIFTTLKTNGEDTLTTPMNSDEDTLMTPVMTHDYLMIPPHDITDNPCDDIDDLEQIIVKYVERLMVGCLLSLLVTAHNSQIRWWRSGRGQRAVMVRLLHRKY
jgi:hypothetical protein